MKNKKEAFKNQKGTTLVEIMLSVALLAIIVTPLLGAVYSSIKNNTTAKDKTEAIALAQRVMGEIKAWKTIAPVDGEYTGARSGDLVPYYEIDKYDEGKVAQSTDSTDSAYSYSTADAKDADFELEINQGDDITDKKLPNIDFYEINRSGEKERVGNVIDFLLAGTCLEFKIDKSVSGYTYCINKKSADGVVTIKSNAFIPKDSNGIVKLKVTYDGVNAPSLAEQLKIFTDIKSSNSSDDNFFKVYVINNEESNSGVNFINKGTTNFEINYMDSNAFNYAGDPLNQLFKVIVTIKKNSTEIYKTTSYVKK